jgi:hypothetical protein
MTNIEKTMLELSALPAETRLGIQLEGIFMPKARAQRDAFFENNKRFVHYTSADAALKIIASKRLWMRNTTCMSDYREVQHGFDILQAFFSDKSKEEKFIAALDSCSNGVAREAIALFSQWWHDTRFHTYISSISEHNDDEDLHGRLSMWRAFGGHAARVAIVLRVPFYSAGAGSLNIMFSPVAYLTKQLAHCEIDRVIQNIDANADFIRVVDRQIILNCVFNMLVSAVCCLKHEGFHEECEWRVIYAPNRRPSAFMEFSTEVIGGIPQIVYKLPLDESASPALADLDLSRIFDRLIVGPSPYAGAIYQAFVAALTNAGVSDAASKVVISGIPIRG